MKYQRICLWIALMVAGGFQLFAQTPLSFSKSFQDTYQPAPLSSEKIPVFDLTQARREDEAFWGQSRFAAPLAVDLGLRNAGQWIELADGGRLWRLQVRSKEALALILLFDRFYLPPGATLHAYGPDRKQVIGPYSRKDNRMKGQFVLGPLNGETAILEYYEPASVKGQGQLHLFRLDHAYHRDNLKAFEKNLNRVSDIGFDTSLPCNKNVNCPEGANVQDQKRAVCRIMMILEEGTGFCTGTLMNNTNEDGTPYVLTAFHCQDGFTPMYDMWRFDFQYEAMGCETPGAEPVPFSIQGCVQRSGRRENDFLLLETSAALPLAAHPFFAGWNRAETAPQRGTILHHPNGDIKKVALDNDPAKIHPASIAWNNEVTTPASHHFELVYDEGTFELGSSGAALLDQDNRVVGQLHGGFNSCSETTGYFGRFSLAWEGGGTPETRLKDWLDPAGTDVMTFDGVEAAQPALGSLGGQIQLEDGRGISNVRIYLSGNGLVDSTLTDASGQFLFEELPMLAGYQLTVEKAESANLGISALDLILIQKHLLSSKPLDSMYKMLAADVNESGSISLIDLVRIRKVLLGQTDGFNDRPIWRFLPKGFVFSDPEDPFSSPRPSSYFITEFGADILEFDLIGYKAGDVNYSADPGN